MYDLNDYHRFGVLMSDYINTLEYDRESIRWTGFKIADRDALVMDILVNYDLGAVGQWVWYTSDKQKFLVVNIPGMQTGKHFKGETFDIGAERVFPAQDAKTISDTKAMIRAGLEKLKELIEAEAV